MAAPKQSFLKAHWDLLVLVGGLSALAGSGLMVMNALNASPETIAAEYEQGLNSQLKAPKKTVAASDLSQLEAVMARAKTPPSLSPVDAKKASFLSSEERIFCGNPKCNRVLTTTAEECPECHTKQKIVKIEADTDHDGLPNEWEKKYGLNPEDPKDANIDSDGDTFTNLEEYKAGTDPKDKVSHPDYLEYLATDGQIQDTTLDFHFENYNGLRFMFRRHRDSFKGPADTRKTFTAKKGEEIRSEDDINDKFCVRTGWKVVDYREKTMSMKINGVPKTINSSEVDIEKDGLKITLKWADDQLKGNPKKPNTKTEAYKEYLNRTTTALASRIDLMWNRGEGKKLKDLSEGSAFELNERKYKVLQLKKTDDGPEVTVLDLATKKEKIIR